MQCDEADVLEFQAIYKKLFGKQIEIPEAHEKANGLLRLMQLICDQNHYSQITQ